YDTVEALLPRSQDDAHAATAQYPQDLVIGHELRSRPSRGPRLPRCTCGCCRVPGCCRCWERCLTTHGRIVGIEFEVFPMLSRRRCLWLTRFTHRCPLRSRAADNSATSADGGTRVSEGQLFIAGTFFCTRGPWFGPAAIPAHF